VIELRLEYVVDMAEIPAFTEIRKMGGDLDAYAAESCPRLVDGLVATLDGKPLELEAIGDSASRGRAESAIASSARLRASGRSSASSERHAR
jgi:hypothetical protein